MNSDDIAEIIIREVRTVVPDLESHPITRADSMVELGVDSIERNEVLVATMEAIDLRLPLVALHGPRNIGELADLLHAKRSA